MVILYSVSPAYQSRPCQRLTLYDMNLTDYFEIDSGLLRFERERASAFAKNVAGDYNPLHDPSNKRFCVPGDLLFCVLVHHYGLPSTVAVQFAGMLDGTSSVSLPEALDGTVHIQDSRERDVLVVECSGEKTTDQAFISNLSEQYVKFSGDTFPGVLVPLMQQHNVMVNPARPLIIYQSMQLTMQRLEGTDLTLESTGASLAMEGKKGTVQLPFIIKAGSDVIGTGTKSMVLGGLREWDTGIMKAVVEEYNTLKSNS